jgi:hypothetical protein
VIGIRKEALMKTRLITLFVMLTALAATFAPIAEAGRGFP